MNKFFDEYGLLHVQPNEPSENGILFAAEYWMLKRLLGQFDILNDDDFNPVWDAFSSNVVNFPKKQFQANPPQEGEHYSHDNLTGMYVMANSFLEHKHDLPIIYWNNRVWLHPRDIAFYFLMKHGDKKWIYFTGLPLLALLLLLVTSLVSCRAPRARTSGKMLWWLRLNALQMHSSSIVRKTSELLLKGLTKLMKKNHGQFPWIDTASIYFKNPEHPVNIKMREYYGS